MQWIMEYWGTLGMRGALRTHGWGDAGGHVGGNDAKSRALNQTHEQGTMHHAYLHESVGSHARMQSRPQRGRVAYACCSTTRRLRDDPPRCTDEVRRPRRRLQELQVRRPLLLSPARVRTRLALVPIVASADRPTRRRPPCKRRSAQSSPSASRASVRAERRGRRRGATVSTAGSVLRDVRWRIGRIPQPIRAAPHLPRDCR